MKALQRLCARQQPAASTSEVFGYRGAILTVGIDGATCMRASETAGGCCGCSTKALGVLLYEQFELHVSHWKSAVAVVAVVAEVR